MKVHFWMGPDGIVPGGHRVQLTQTAQALRRLGVDVHTGADPLDARPLPDIVHAYGAAPGEVRRWRNAGLRTAASTIYLALAYRHGLSGPRGRSGAAAHRLRLGAVMALAAARGHAFRKCHELITDDLRLARQYEAVDVILPNSPMEARAIRDELGVTTPAWPVPNGVDHRLFSRPAGSDRPIDVLYVGRFEPHKNQLQLVEALRRTSLRVVIVGAQHPHHPTYRDRCQALAAGSTVEIRPELPHEQLPELYRSAKVHVLPSWFETTGLVSLEAALAGCRIVTTDRGYVDDYFAGLAWFCNPANASSIRHAVQSALAAEVTPPLGQHVLDNFTWDHAGRATLDAYEALLEGRQEAAPRDWAGRDYPGAPSR